MDTSVNPSILASALLPPQFLAQIPRSPHWICPPPPPHAHGHFDFSGERVICMDAKANQSLGPCHHCCMCATCWNNALQQRAVPLSHLPHASCFFPYCALPLAAFWDKAPCCLGGKRRWKKRKKMLGRLLSHSFGGLHLTTACRPVGFTLLGLQVCDFIHGELWNLHLQKRG